MIQFILKRLSFIAVVSLIIIYLVFLGMGMARNSEVANPNYDLVSHSQAAWAKTRLFVNDLAHGDWGTYTSDTGIVEIGTMVRTSFVNSMGLLLVALGGAALLGTYLGSVAALRQRSSLLLLSVSVLGISAPSFFAAILLQQGVIRYTAVYGRRILSVGGFGWDVDHMLLPVLVLSARPLAYLTRASFISLGHVMQQDYIRTAYAKGLGRIRAVNYHAVPNILIPVLTAVGVSLRFSLSTLPVVELFFGWPGMGNRLLDAINNRQTPVVAALAFTLGLTFFSINLLLDIIYRWVDPRLREEA
ncbi:MAG: ABC transporter permease [Anaerolineae bacterium]